MHARQIGALAALLIPAVSSDASSYRDLQLLLLSGDRQHGVAGQVLPEPIVARLVDDAGNGVKDISVEFQVNRGGGRLIDASGSEHVEIILTTDANGDVTAAFRIGPGTGSRQNLVSVMSSVARHPAHFCFMSAAAGSAVCPADPYATKTMSTGGLKFDQLFNAFNSEAL